MTSLPPFLKKTTSGVHLTVKLQPKGSKDEIVGILGEALKVRVRAAPTQGHANRALRQLFSNLFRVPLQKIKILTGEKSRIKTVEILDISSKECLTVVSRPHYHGEKDGKS